MKKYIVLLTVGVLSVVAGCRKDPLDITPDGRLTLDGVFKDERLTEAYLNSAYEEIPLYFYRYQFFSFLAGTTDECQDSDDGNEGSNIAANWATGSLTPSYNPLEQGGQGAGVLTNAGVNHYGRFWAGIRKANLFLENVPTATISNPVNRSRFTAEAKLLRAFYYLELVKQFGPMPIVEKPFTISTDFTTLTRPTFQDNINFIVKNCDEALASPDLPLRITENAERGRFTKAIAHAIKSQALLYNASPLWNSSGDAAKWKAAADASKQALTALTAGGQYALAADYGNYFLNQTDISAAPADRETIFERPDNTDGTFTIINSFAAKTGVFKAGSCPTQELVDGYDMQATGEPAITGYSDEDHLKPIINATSGYSETDPYKGRDPRFYATVWHNGAAYGTINGVPYTMETFVGGSSGLKRVPPNRQNTQTGYYLRKFIDPKLASGTTANSRWKKYRLAEIYLNYAEAENEASGPTADVYSAINTIRTRAKMPNLPNGLTKEQMRERIRRERRVELAIEEHRFWDVRRWKILSQTDKLVTGMEITKKTDGTFSYARFVARRRSAWQDKFLIFPIPIGEVSTVPDFSKNQNPGW
ncbi:RagB/SusD family nutrient uptake outer membrane protein [Rudanella paleaurantiibacter]|uniref:RagB/SusD family nutrient uptake outer membrane protein n=1 Tax=Rudanella paleaurantiibacter TaxID=2614655 RepID=A0A7J5TT45_9BACT|nr:RagB/SusD family nutrient uptake outer membrane protein [Rudanella paleaurantiibacter]KAB7726703.1 RagB/SusD family nutrient uptake outer membrane protein [Rudanella paleaurantiibacter]